MLGGGRECQNSPSGRHNLGREKRTEANGRVRTVVYCTHCGMER